MTSRSGPGNERLTTKPAQAERPRTRSPPRRRRGQAGPSPISRMPPRGGKGLSPAEGEGSTPEGSGGEGTRGARTGRRESRTGNHRSWDDALVHSLKASRLGEGRGASEMGTPRAAGGLSERSPLMAARNLLTAGMDRLGLGHSPPRSPAGTPSRSAVAAEEGSGGTPLPSEGLQGGRPLPSPASPA